MQLSQYQEDVAGLIRDSNNLQIPVTQLNRYINLARYQVCKRTACLNYLVPGDAPFGNAAQAGSLIPGAATAGSPTFQLFQTIVGVEVYPYTYGNQFLRANNQGVANIIDVINVSVSWGGLRPSMTYMPWDDLQAYARSYNIGVFSYPFLWSVSGDGENGKVWLFPVPDINTSPQTQGSQGEMEWYVTASPKPLYSNNDYDAIPEPFQGAVKYYACYLCYLSMQRAEAAQMMLALFDDHLIIDRVASDRGKTEQYYPDGLY